MITQEFTKNGHRYIVSKEAGEQTKHIWIYRDGKPFRHLIENEKKRLNCFNLQCSMPNVIMFECFNTFENYKYPEY